MAVLEDECQIWVLLCGTPIKPVFKSPANDPTAYEVRSTLLALRKEDAKNIEIE